MSRKNKQNKTRFDRMLEKYLKQSKEKQKDVRAREKRKQGIKEKPRVKPVKQDN